MFWLVLVLGVCAYLLFRLVRAVEGRNRATSTVTAPASNPLQRREFSDEDREKLVEFTLKHVQEFEAVYRGLLERQEECKAGALRALYIESSRTLASKAMLAQVFVVGLLKNRFPDLDEDEMVKRAESLLDAAEAHAREVGADEALRSNIGALHRSAMACVQTGRKAFNAFLAEPDPTVTEDDSVDALKALPHLLDEAFKACSKANHIFRNLPGQEDLPKASGT